jgi:hypothetical protein
MAATCAANFALLVSFHGDPVARLQGRWAPALAIQISGRAHLQAPLFFLTLVVLHDQLDIAVRIGPLKLTNRTAQTLCLLRVEHRRGVMCRAGRSGEQHRDTADKGPFRLHAKSPVRCDPVERFRENTRLLVVILLAGRPYPTEAG